MNDSMNSFSFPSSLPSGKSGNTESLFSTSFAGYLITWSSSYAGVAGGGRGGLEIEREKSAAQMKTAAKFNIFLSEDVGEGERRKKNVCLAKVETL